MSSYNRRELLTSIAALMAGTTLTGVSGSQAFAHANEADYEIDERLQGTFRITLKAYSVIDPPFSQPAVHHEVSFYYPDGELFQTLNGHPFDRASGDISLGVGDNKTLRVIHDSSKDYEALTGDEPISEVTLWEGDRVGFYDKLFRSREAATFINQQNLDYELVNPFVTSQNSNSVAYTMVRVMGLDFPPETWGTWAPGHGRYLMPDRFQSFFDRYPVTEDTFFDFLPRQVRDGPSGIHDAYTSMIFNRLSVQSIQEDVKAENIDRTGEPAKRFDPENPKPTAPLGYYYYEQAGEVAPTSPHL